MYAIRSYYERARPWRYSKRSQPVSTAALKMPRAIAESACRHAGAEAWDHLYVSERDNLHSSSAIRLVPVKLFESYNFV